MWYYDEGWTVGTEDAIRATYAEAGIPYDTARASVWNARCMSQAASGQLTKQDARWSTLNSLRDQIWLARLPEPLWCGDELGTLRVDGLNILNDRPDALGTVLWLVRGYRMFDTLCLHLYGIQSFDRSLDYPCRLGFNTIFLAAMMKGSNGHPADLDPRVNTDLYTKLAEVADIAHRRGVRLWVYACADASALGISEADQHAHWLSVCHVLQGGYHIVSVGNETSNGNSADPTRFPAPTNCPIWTRGSNGEFSVSPNGATVCEIEVKRRSTSEEPFKMIADAASVEYHTTEMSGPLLQRPVVRVEDTFAAEAENLGRRSNNPYIFVATAAAAAATRLKGSGGSAFGSDDSAVGKALTGHQDACARAAVQAMRTAFTI